MWTKQCVKDSKSFKNIRYFYFTPCKLIVYYLIKIFVKKKILLLFYIFSLSKVVCWCRTSRTKLKNAFLTRCKKQTNKKTLHKRCKCCLHEGDTPPKHSEHTGSDLWTCCLSCFNSLFVIHNTSIFLLLTHTIISKSDKGFCFSFSPKETFVAFFIVTHFGWNGLGTFGQRPRLWVWVKKSPNQAGLCANK